MSIAYIALGSNLDSEHGTRTQMLSAAARRLQSLGTITARSSLYETEPVGFRDQAHFINAVLALRTEMQPLSLLRALLGIEQEFGRDRATSIPKGPRTLDLDLLMVEDSIVTTDELTLPHPAFAQRRFVLEPLSEIAPRLRPPGSQQTVTQLLAALPAEGEHREAAVRRLPEPWE